MKTSEEGAVLYKVTPMMAPPVPESAKKKAAEADREPRKRRKSAVYDAEGNEVLITMMCLKCRAMKPLAMFGLRKMADGAIRNQPWCRTCRSKTGSKKQPAELVAPEAASTASAPSADLTIQIAAQAILATTEPVELLTESTVVEEPPAFEFTASEGSNDVAQLVSFEDATA
jgi:hypothetical protein